MRKIILMAVAGYLWKKFKANRASGTVANSGRSFTTARGPAASRSSDLY